MRCYIEVDAPGFPPERFEVSPGSGTIGSGETDVVFVHPGAGLGPSAISVDVGESGVELQVHEPARLTKDGKPCQAAFVSWGDEVYADSVCFTMLAEEGSAKGTSPLVWVLVFLLALVGAGLALEEMEQSYDEAPPVQHGFSPPPSIECPVLGPEKALLAAKNAGLFAQAKMERYPFALQDGPGALALLAKQVSCLTTAGAKDEAQRVTQTLSDWAERLDQDQSELETALFHHLREDRPQKALRVARDLETLVAASKAVEGSKAEPAPKYLAWLKTLKRDLSWRVARK